MSVLALTHTQTPSLFSSSLLLFFSSSSSFSSRYRSIAEQATGQVASVRQQSQIDRLESIQLSEKERKNFETKVM